MHFRKRISQLSSSRRCDLRQKKERRMPNENFLYCQVDRRVSLNEQGIKVGLLEQDWRSRQWTAYCSLTHPSISHPLASSSTKREKGIMSIYNDIGAQFTASFGMLLIVAGVSGNLLNVLVFRLNNLRNPSIFLLFVSSCASLVYLLGSLLVRVLFVGFNVQSLRSSWIWCKLRVHIGQVAWFISISCICYAVIDRFCVSSREQKWRRRSQTSTTRWITVIIILFWFCHALPILIFPDVVVVAQGRPRCNSLFVPYFSRYVAYFVLPILAMIGPVTVLILFGCLTHRNLNSISSISHRQRVQRPLTSMILLQTTFVVIASAPLTVFYLYSAITASTKKSVVQHGVDSLALDIALVLYGFPHASSFFAYSFSSSTYRQQLRRLLRLSPTRQRFPSSPLMPLTVKASHILEQPNDEWRETFFDLGVFSPQKENHAIQFTNGLKGRLCLFCS